MTFDEKVSLLRQVFQQVSNHGILSWGPMESGFRWKCEDHSTAVRLITALYANLELLKLDRKSFPHRFEPESGEILVVEPVGDEN